MAKRGRRILAAASALALVGGCTTTYVQADSPPPAPVASAFVNQPVQTRQGQVLGVPGKLDGVSVFKGLPFAAPPVGELRWEMPRPPANWEGIRRADMWGDNCVQTAAPQRFPVNSATDMADSPGISEDCLYLNIWTPADNATERLPVMVWLYGGAYSEGGGSAPFSQGDHLAQKGAVVVTLNYRVGALGFFSHPELSAASPHGASGNQALGDVIAALEWVKANITAFGGDPSRVTIFGESAGAAMTGGLVGAPAARDLVHRAIPQSGAWMGLGIATMTTREQAEAQAMQQAQAQFGTASLANLRALPASEIHQKLRGAGMIVDGHIIPEDVSLVVAEGRQNPWDVLAGSNEDEGSFTAFFGPPATLASWQAGEAMRWGSDPAVVELGRAAYPAATDAEALAQSVRPFSDAMSWHMRQYAAAQAQLGRSAYFYYFTHDPLYDEGRADLGAAHTGEIPYVFGNLCAPRTFPGGSSVELMCGNPREERFAHELSRYWVNFAATGDPNGPGLPHWPAFARTGELEAMRLDADGSKIGPWLSGAQVELFQMQYRQRVARPLGIAE